MSEIRVGISGWTYEPWRGNFYPQNLSQKNELAYASRRFNIIEINGTFYSLQFPSSFQHWHAITPPGFVFALKGSRYITHMLRLKEARRPLANFLASGLLSLREKLGPILWQFPPNMPFQEDRFQQFFELLPHDTEQLSRFAARYAKLPRERRDVDTDARRPLRHAVEFRHESFLTERFIALLRKHNISLVIADVASRFPTAEDITADWVYVRLHGSRQLYASGYSPREIRLWSEKIQAWHLGREPADARRIGARARPAGGGRDVYVFFDNTDVKLRAPVDARRMARVLGIGPATTVRQVLREVGTKRQS